MFSSPRNPDDEQPDPHEAVPNNGDIEDNSERVRPPIRHTFDCGESLPLLTHPTKQPFRALPEGFQLRDQIGIPIAYHQRVGRLKNGKIHDLTEISVHSNEIIEVIQDIVSALDLSTVDIIIGSLHENPAHSPDEIVRKDVERELVSAALDPLSDLLQHDPCLTVTICAENFELHLNSCKNIICSPGKNINIRPLLVERGIARHDEFIDPMKLEYELHPIPANVADFNSLSDSHWGVPHSPARLRIAPALQDKVANIPEKLIEGYKVMSQASSSTSTVLCITASHDKLLGLYLELLREIDSPVSVFVEHPERPRRFTYYRGDQRDLEATIDLIVDSWEYLSGQDTFSLAVLGTDTTGERYELVLNRLNSLTLCTSDPTRAGEILERRQLPEIVEVVFPEDETIRFAFKDNLDEGTPRSYARDYLDLYPNYPDAITDGINAVVEFGYKAFMYAKKIRNTLFW